MMRAVAGGIGGVVACWLVFVLGTYLYNGMYRLPLDDLYGNPDPKDAPPFYGFGGGLGLFATLLGPAAVLILAATAILTLVTKWRVLAATTRLTAALATAVALAFFALSRTPFWAALANWIYD